jgi:small conductance mechanosensitive channel
MQNITIDGINADAVWDWIETTGWDIIITVVLAFIYYFVIRLVIEFILRSVTRARIKTTRVSKSELKQRQKTIMELLRMMLKVIIAAVAVFTILAKDFGINLAPLLASAGIIGVALGFGAQSIIKDALAGFFVILENQYRIGDYIEVDGAGMDRAKGTVERISLRSTALRDRDGDLHFIPNGQITQVINRTIGFSKVNFTFRVATTEKIEIVQQIINETGTHMAVDKKWSSKIKEAIHFSEMSDFDGESYEITVTGVTEPAAQWKVTSEYRTRLLKNLKKNGIQLV